MSTASCLFEIPLGITNYQLKMSEHPSGIGKHNMIDSSLRELKLGSLFRKTFLKVWTDTPFRAISFRKIHRPFTTLIQK